MAVKLKLGGADAASIKADLLVVTGDPADPRTSVEAVYVKGERMYDAEVRRRW